MPLPVKTSLQARLGAVGRPALPDLVLALGAVSLTLSLLFVLGVPGYWKLRDQVREAAVRGNAVTLQLAAETYAYAHQGRFAEDPLDLVPYLPDDAAPANPYTGRASRFLADVGEVTYRSPGGGVDYLIEAYGPGPGGLPRLLGTWQSRKEWTP